MMVQNHSRNDRGKILNIIRVVSYQNGQVWENQFVYISPLFFMEKVRALKCVLPNCWARPARNFCIDVPPAFGTCVNATASTS